MSSKLTKAISKKNFISFLWHAGFLALAQSFLDIDTIVPAMLIEAGGTSMHIGIMATILTGGSSLTQILFAPYVSNKSLKKKYLLLGINTRMFALLGLGTILFFLTSHQQGNMIWLIFLFITIFAIGGAFANVSYTDIVGKSILQDDRKSFFSSKQMLTGIVLVISAFFAKQVISSTGFPMNYAYAILIGFAALSIASLGFWRIKEVIPASLPIKNFKAFLRIMKSELKDNPRLGYFLGFVNTQGIVISFLPFIILYAKEYFQLDSSGIGNMLIFKISGSVLISILIFVYSKRIKYRNILYLNSLLAISLPLLVMLPKGTPPFFLIFLIGGIVFALYTISMNGVLLEISGNHNRAIYAGFAGAGNIIPALFPLLGGWLIKTVSFESFFILFIVIVSSSLFFIYKIKCVK